MPRKPRLIATGVPHHITHRGNNRGDIFFREQDRVLYLSLLFEQASKHHLSILGYCLMPNHIHLVAIPNLNSSLADTIKVAHGQYARSINSMRGACGHLWQARYFSCAMEDVYCWRALRYVENNPVRAGLVSEASAYLYSSARLHLSLSYPPVLDFQESVDRTEWQKRYTSDEWKRVLQIGVFDEAVERRIREATMLGRLLAVPYSNASHVRAKAQPQFRSIRISSSPEAVLRRACFT